MLGHRALADAEPPCHALVRTAFREQAEHLALSLGQPRRAETRRGCAEHPAHHFGIEHGTAGRDAPQRARDLAEVGDPVLEQIADTARVVADQLERVARLDVLAEHEYADLRVRPADRHGRSEPIVGMRGRHPDVGHDHVGLMRADLADEVVGVTGLRDDLEAVRLEHARLPLAQQGVVVGQDDAERALVQIGRHDPIETLPPVERYG